MGSVVGNSSNRKQKIQPERSFWATGEAGGDWEELGCEERGLELWLACPQPARAQETRVSQAVQKCENVYIFSLAPTQPYFLYLFIVLFSPKQTCSPLRHKLCSGTRCGRPPKGIRSENLSSSGAELCNLGKGSSLL